MSTTRGLRRAVRDGLYGIKRLLLRLAPVLDRVGLRRLRVVDVAHGRDLLGRGVENLKVLIAGGPVTFAPKDEPFLRVSKYYPEGTFERPEVFVCEVPFGLVHVGTGIVLTAGGTIIEESVLGYRLPYTSVYQGLRPLRPIRIRGSVATVFNVFGDNFWHLLVDSLPRLVSLRKVLPDAEAVTLVLPDTLHVAQRELLTTLLPASVSVRLLPKRAWVRADRVILPSLLTGRANGFLPADYVNDIRRDVFRGFRLPEAAQPRSRIWVSRAGAAHRRVGNEPAVMEALAPMGFVSVRPEFLSMREQVELFKNAAIVVGPHGAGLGATLFSGRIPVVVLYPNEVPNTFFFTQACGLGQKHLFVLHGARDEDDDFEADVPRLKTLLERELGMRPSGP
jgi:hypothetical protein